MKNRDSRKLFGIIPLSLLILPFSAQAQVPVDDDGNVIGTFEDDSYPAYSSEPATGEEGIPLLSATELAELVGPIALYPDDLLAVVLPAATFPLQVVQAARFLEDLESNPEAQPNADWDDSIIALVNYPEVVELLNEDLDWTWRLGEAVVAQQSDVVNAVEEFRDRAYAAGNLKSDRHQTVTHDEGIIEITPVNEEVIYVPYYEPARVVHYSPRPVYYYYPRPCPVYYYPYASNYAFNRGYFWGVTTAFRIGWASDHLRVFHHSYHGHPYYGRRYWERWWYRRPSIHVHNNVYFNNNSRYTRNRYSSGDHWRSNRSTRLRASDQRITRNVHYANGRTTSTTTSRRSNGRAVEDTQRRRSDRQVTNRTPRTNSQRQRETQANQSRQRPSTTRGERQRETQTNQSRQRPSTTRSPRQRETQANQSRQRPSTQRQTTERRTVQRQAAQSQTAQRQSASRQTSERQRAATANQQRRATVQRQTRQSSASRRQVQRAETARRQPQSRQQSQRTQQQTQRRSTQQSQTSDSSNKRSSQGSARSSERQSSERSGSSRGQRRDR